MAREPSSWELRAPHTSLLGTAWPVLKTPGPPEPHTQSMFSELGRQRSKFVRHNGRKRKARLSSSK